MHLHGEPVLLLPWSQSFRDSRGVITKYCPDLKCGQKIFLMCLYFYLTIYYIITFNMDKYNFDNLSLRSVKDPLSSLVPPPWGSHPQVGNHWSTRTITDILNLVLGVNLSLLFFFLISGVQFLFIQSEFKVTKFYPKSRRDWSWCNISELNHEYTLPLPWTVSRKIWFPIIYSDTIILKKCCFSSTRAWVQEMSTGNQIIKVLFRGRIIIAM